MVEEEFITAYSSGNKVYYYVILEYPNLDEPQNYDLEGSIEGEVTVEESGIKPDINILAAYVIQDDGEYKQVEDIPQDGYQLNTEKSTCSNGTIPGWDVKAKRFYADNLNKSGTKCYLYFDKILDITKPIITILDIIDSANPKDITPNFANVAATDEGVYKVEDGMYGGYSYYWRGATTNNYVMFAGFCWRIVRINGDGSMRLIYDGSSCHANGTSTAKSVIIGSTDADKYYATSDGKYDNSSYVGWTYSLGSQRTIEGTASNAKIQTEKWYNANITGTNANKVADGKFCNDRNVGAKYSGWNGTWATTWSATGTAFAYAGVDRLRNKYQPTLSCSTEDIYTLKVGAITADEVAYGGGKNENNSSYYLYNGQSYWTMSPYYWSGSSTRVFYIRDDGFLSNADVNSVLGLRPVINLRANTEFQVSGNGTVNSPYVVVD